MIALLIVILVLLVVLLCLVGFLIVKTNKPPALAVPDPRIDALLVESKSSNQMARDELALLRREQLEQAGALREELGRRLEANQQGVLARLDENRRDAQSQAETTRQAIDTRLVEARESADKSLTALRTEATEASAAARSESRQQFGEFQQGMRTAFDDARGAQTEQIKAISTTLAEFGTAVSAHLNTIRELVDSRLREAAEAADGRITRLRTELTENATLGRTENRQQFTEFQSAIKNVLSESQQSQSSQLSDFAQRLKELNTAVTEQLDRIRQTVEQRLTELQTQNATKLDEMRQTVDQRLQTTLEQRLGESFKIVSESLERVSVGLGEMQSIAAGVGDLKKVLTNVKTRGTWSEFQLGALLEQMLTPDQYASNVAPNPATADRVEFAVKLPGKAAADQPVWLPIDAKFPVEDYQRLLEASERADVEGIASAGNALEVRLRAAAKDISTKYVAAPYTTDFAILYLPTEGLYAEALRRPGLVESLQRQYRILIAGPMTLAALLNSLQMGFRTLAIQQRSSEVWEVLGAVKTEFGKFGEVIAKVKKKLDEASSQIDQTGVRSRAIERRLRSVETLPAEDVARLLPSVIESNGDSEDEPAP